MNDAAKHKMEDLVLLLKRCRYVRPIMESHSRKMLFNVKSLQEFAQSVKDSMFLGYEFGDITDGEVRDLASAINYLNLTDWPQEARDRLDTVLAYQALAE